MAEQFLFFSSNEYKYTYDNATIEFLGKGKFGIVYKVLENKTKVPVAIKMITCNKEDNKS